MSRIIRSDMTDEFRKLSFEELLEVFDSRYFSGNDYNKVFGYDEYENCKSILNTWSRIILWHYQPESVLDVGTAYGFVPEWFRNKGIKADGIEPSGYARSKANIDLYDGYIPGGMPQLEQLYDIVLCTEVLEHVITENFEAEAEAAIKDLMFAAERNVICLLMTGDYDEYHEDPTHIHLRPIDWWYDRFDNACYDSWHIDDEDMTFLNTHPYSQKMDWDGRIFVLRNNNV